MGHKLGPELRSRLRAERSKAAAYQALSPEGGAAEEAVARVRIIMEFTGDLVDLTDIGFEVRSFIEHPTEGYKIATGTLPADRIEELARIEHLVEADLPKTLHPLLDYSRPETRTNSVHTGSPSRKGAGVVIGIIDTGIDWRHGSFLEPDQQSSRILGIWDQLLAAKSGETKGPKDLGVVYTQEQISRALRGEETVRTLDKGSSKDDALKNAGHGTHVAGIAAGDGSPASCCTTSNTYVGIAPLAELIAVRTDFSEDHLVEAIDFIFSHPDAAGKPVVINISLGTNIGPHDGTTKLERCIDAIIAAQSGRAIVVAAGNQGDTEGHVEGTVSGNRTVEIDFNVPEGGGEDVFVDLWYDRAGTLNLEVVAEGGATSGVVTHGNPLPPFAANPAADADRQSMVEIFGAINGPHGRNNNFHTKINKPTLGNIPPGSWKLRLINPTATDIDFHCWIAPEDAAQFIDPSDGNVRVSSSSTIIWPGTAAGAITVANHESKTGGCDCWPSTGIAASSSRGPVARGAAGNPKPDIAAPGLIIASAKADVANLPGNCCDCCPDMCCILYEDRSGTSMAAPHVTGAIALMLEENPNLTKAQILQHLQDSARDRPAGGRDNAFGAGKLDVQAAINAVRNAGGGGGGGGGSPSSPLQFSPAGSIGLLTPPAGAWLPSADPGSSPRRLNNGLAAAAQLPPALRILRARMQALPEGEHLAAAASRHFSEIRRLINTNRRVATMWHRSDGPRLLRRLLLGAIDPEAPAALVTERQLDYLDRLYDQLVKYGSQRLRASLERYRATLFRLLQLPLAAQITAVKGGGHD